MLFLSFVFWPDYTLQLAASDAEVDYFQFWYNTLLPAQVLIGQFKH